ncbi:MAG: HAD-IIB family hydrolase, partial [Hyphomicrobiales bacterium]
MHFLGFSVDFDGTIAHDGVVAPGTLQALLALKSSGRRLVLVTGRELVDLVAQFPQYAIFDRLVLENGGVLLDPATGEHRMLAPPPDPALVDHLQRLGIDRMSVGKAVIAAWEPDRDRVLDAIRQSGLELQITFNKGAIMVLPTGINKGTGLLAAAAELSIALPAFVGVGDGENDHSFLKLCGCSVAVSNAIASIKSEVDIVLEQEKGEGVAFLVADLLRLDAELLPAERRGIEVGTD